ncbi:MAG TPA: caspase family protein [Bacteroidales bacterium]|nr:caspase family protein [Bacteroidales bacterium]HPI31122.1 caspase family protein [Bacteroidales bacterium]
MNRIFFLLPALCCMFTFSGLQAQNKRALVIAVGDYNYATTRWRPISSAQDVPLIKNALLTQGFKEADIRLLQDKDADKAGIVKAFDDLAANTHPGDVVFVHFSGHGQQIEDNDGDEIDGFDEALIPVNAHQFFKKDVYEGENHLRDDEFGKLLNTVREKAGPKGNVMVVVDACHSGTSTRGENNTRGTSEVFASPGYKPADNKAAPENYGVYTEDDKLAPMACFYGASAHQLNYEYKVNDSTYVGSLSYAFSKAFGESTPLTTYKGLFDRIRVIMASVAPNQAPQAEGTLDQYILAGKITGAPDYAMVQGFFDEKNVSINRGLLHGVNKGTKVGFYNVDEREYKNAIPKATGTVVFSDYTSADILLDQPLKEDIAVNSWVYITVQNFGDMALPVKLDLSNQDLLTAIRTKTEEYPLIQIKDTDYELLIEENNRFTRGNNIMISTVKDIELWSSTAEIIDAANAAGEITERLIAYAQSRFLRQLEVDDSKLSADLKIIPFKVKQEGRNVVEDGEMPLSERTDETGNLFLKNGDVCKVQITNTASQTIYFTILDIQPDDVLSILLPVKGRLPQEYRIEPGQTFTSPLIKIGPPYGNEVFKLITSATPLDLTTVVRTRGQNPETRGDEVNPFQKLIAETYRPDGNTRGGETMSLPAGSVYVKSFVFQIKPGN